MPMKRMQIRIMLARTISATVLLGRTAWLAVVVVLGAAVTLVLGGSVVKDCDGTEELTETEIEDAVDVISEDIVDTPDGTCVAKLVGPGPWEIVVRSVTVTKTTFEAAIAVVRIADSAGYNL
jgi:hypothetical protein